MGETLWGNTGMMECGDCASQGHHRPTHLCCPVSLGLDPIVTFGTLVKTQDSYQTLLIRCLVILLQDFLRPGFLSLEFEQFLLICSFPAATPSLWVRGSSSQVFLSKILNV